MHSGPLPIDSQHDIGGLHTLTPHWTPVAPWSPLELEDDEELELAELALLEVEAGELLEAEALEPPFP
jgi:hypothetical protein